MVVFSAGNDNWNYLRYPANSIPDIITVGAMSPCGQRKSPNSCDNETWWGSNYGSALDLVAPGVFIPTTDLTGANGDSSGDYFMTFNGTSAACPHVAATAALILAVNPNLTQKQVSAIIETTARKVGGYAYATTSGRSNGTWHSEMGYGMLNSSGAVSLTLSTVVNFNNITFSTGQYVGGWKISTMNVTSTNYAPLHLFPYQELTIQAPFTINAGSEFKVKI